MKGQLWLCVVALFSIIYTKPTSLPPVSLWPQPTEAQLGQSVFFIRPHSIQIQANTKNQVLASAIQRLRSQMEKAYNYVDVSYPSRPPTSTASGEVKSLSITVTDPNQPLTFGVDESYQLVVNQASTLQAKTIWGALHGLTTFAQFCQWNGTVYVFQSMPALIRDSPSFKWRGMLVDTSRHYLSLNTIKSTIDLLALNKMNVLHWHLVDAESFSLQLPSIPNLSKEGAWTPQAVYTPSQVQQIIQYANHRGVRVVPEIDTPGHVYSWGKAYPSIILECVNMIKKKGYPGINNVPFDVTNNLTYRVVDQVMADVKKLFPNEPFIHLGGDEISESCVDEFPRIKQWMKEHDMNTTDYTDLIAYYERLLINIVKPKGFKMIFWQELFQMFIKSPNNPLPTDTIIHVWKNAGSADLIREIVMAGYQTLLSSGWYLDQQKPARDGTSTHYLWLDTWIDFYNNDPLANLRDLSPSQQALVLGGEVAQWGEQIDDASIITRTWPRASAAAERLWSAKMQDSQIAFHRLAGHRCRMYQQNFSVSPLRPDFCMRR